MAATLHDVTGPQQRYNQCIPHFVEHIRDFLRQIKSVQNIVT